MPLQTSPEDVSKSPVTWPTGFAPTQTPDEYVAYCKALVDAAVATARQTPKVWDVNGLAETMQAAAPLDRTAAYRRQRFDTDRHPLVRPVTTEQEYTRGVKKLVRDAVQAAARRGLIELVRPAQANKQVGKGGTLTFRAYTTDELALRKQRRAEAVQLTRELAPAPVRREPKAKALTITCDNTMQYEALLAAQNHVREMQAKLAPVAPPKPAAAGPDPLLPKDQLPGGANGLRYGQ